MSEMTFAIKGEFIELAKLLKATGSVENGGAARHAITESQVLVDGQIETRRGRKIRRGQKVAFDGTTILIQ